MGATFQARSFDLMDATELAREFKVFQHGECEQYGNDAYAGHLGIKDGLSVTAEKFESYGQAESWIEENNDKWGPAHAVKFIHQGPPEFPHTKADDELNRRYKALKHQIHEGFEQEVISRARKMKSKLYTCRKCGSKIATKFIKEIYCPVCSSGEFLYTPTDAKRVKAWLNKMETLRVRIEKRKVALKNSDKKNHRTYRWLIGGWCAS